MHMPTPSLQNDNATPRFMEPARIGGKALGDCVPSPASSADAKYDASNCGAVYAGGILSEPVLVVRESQR